MSLRSAFQNSRKSSSIEITNHFPPWLGYSWDDMVNKTLSTDDAKLTIAKEHGFSDWESIVSLGDKTPDAAFERAVDALVSGQIDRLEILLRENDHIARARSVFGHHATLFHYLGSNGVEIRRQTVPDNLVEIGKLLLEYGADPKARCHVYGGEFTAFDLASTSAHPVDAGFSKELTAFLKAAME